MTKHTQTRTKGKNSERGNTPGDWKFPNQERLGSERRSTDRQRRPRNELPAPWKLRRDSLENRRASAYHGGLSHLREQHIDRQHRRNCHAFPGVRNLVEAGLNHTAAVPLAVRSL